MKSISYIHNQKPPLMLSISTPTTTEPQGTSYRKTTKNEVSCKNIEYDDNQYDYGKYNII